MMESTIEPTHYFLGSFHRTRLEYVLCKKCTTLFITKEYKPDKRIQIVVQRIHNKRNRISYAMLYENL